MEEQMDGQTLLHKTIPATARGPIKFFAFNHLVSNGLNESTIGIDCGFIMNFRVVCLVKANNHLI